MPNVNRHLDKLGRHATDKVTGMTGVITSVSFDLYGCVQVVLNPGVDSTGKMVDGHWLDIQRLKIKGSKPVMDVPDFGLGYVAEGRKGPADKPVPGI